MIPGEEGEARSIGAEAGGGVEVVALDEDAPVIIAVEIDADNGVDGFRAAGVVLTDADDAVPLAVHDEVGVAIAVAGSQQLGLGAEALAVEVLIAIIGEVDDAIHNSEHAAAVLMNGGAGIEVGRGAFGDGAIGGAAHDGIATALHGAAFEPVDVFAIDGNFQQGDRLGGDEVGGDGGFPGAVGCLCGHVGSLVEMG